MTRLIVFMRLARISNLPTVWSNVLAASALSGHRLEWNDLLQVALAMSLFYVGGMFLNDAFDRRIDALERPERPLPSGAVAPATVWTAGVIFLGLGALLLAAFGSIAALTGLALLAAALIYDAWHKGNPLAPFVMGSCRALVYLGTAAAAGAALTGTILGASGALLAYVAGLSFAAKDEVFDRIESLWPLALLALPVAHALALNPIDAPTLAFAAVAAAVVCVAVGWLRRRSPGDVGRAVHLLIAAIALNDGVVASASASPGIALACCGLFLLTLVLQRFIPGT